MTDTEQPIFILTIKSPFGIGIMLYITVENDNALKIVLVWGQLVSSRISLYPFKETPSNFQHKSYV